MNQDDIAEFVKKRLSFDQQRFTFASVELSVDRFLHCLYALPLWRSSGSHVSPPPSVRNQRFLQRNMPFSVFRHPFDFISPASAFARARGVSFIAYTYTGYIRFQREKKIYKRKERGFTLSLFSVFRISPRIFVFRTKSRCTYSQQARSQGGSPFRLVSCRMHKACKDRSAYPRSFSFLRYTSRISMP